MGLESEIDEIFFQYYPGDYSERCREFDERVANIIYSKGSDSLFPELSGLYSVDYVLSKVRDQQDAVAGVVTRSRVYHSLHRLSDSGIIEYRQKSGYGSRKFAAKVEGLLVEARFSLQESLHEEVGRIYADNDENDPRFYLGAFERRTGRIGFLIGAYQEGRIRFSMRTTPELDFDEVALSGEIGEEYRQHHGEPGLAYPISFWASNLDIEVRVELPQHFYERYALIVLDNR